MTIWGRLFAGIFTLVFAPAALAAEACTMMWCNEGVSIEFQPPITAKGKYEFIVMADGVATRCSAVLPLPDCSQSAVMCDGEKVIIEQSGCALPEGGHSLTGLRIEGMPEMVELRIMAAGGRKYQSSHAIKPSCNYPNGKGCDDRQCCSANLVINTGW